MIEMYLHCGDVDSAQLMFEGLQNKDIRSYNAMIKGFVHLKQYKKALLYYDLLILKTFQTQNYRQLIAFFIDYFQQIYPGLNWPNAHTLILKIYFTQKLQKNKSVTNQLKNRKIIIV